MLSGPIKCYAVVFVVAGCGKSDLDVEPVLPAGSWIRPLSEAKRALKWPGVCKFSEQREQFLVLLPITTWNLHFLFDSGPGAQFSVQLICQSSIPAIINLFPIFQPIFHFCRG
jgi:hypothetical protein